MQSRKKRKVVEVPPVPPGVGGDLYGKFVAVPERFFSRVLYANPVCMLVSRKEKSFNVMTISWLSCVNNNGVVMLSMNEGRRSAEMLFEDGYKGRFTLCVPVEGSEMLLRRIGGESGSTVDKFTSLNLTLCPVGTTDTPLASLSAPAAVDHPYIVAHLDCEILEGAHKYNHHVFFATIKQAFVRSRYWAGDTFQPVDASLPSYLTFFGGGKFGRAAPIPQRAPDKEPSEDKKPAADDDELEKMKLQIIALKRENRALKKSNES
eukprot:TRINITY_DN10278_c0_g1_i1.p1 TRINITY_DN10278_c0_g1~~TRINITY_DN10278_c0_g1_i1.p1  ORF type:complete len:263 (+),score=62.49 TRINITY_DN10278_c0_g1_i1:34-822(+)